MKRLSFSLPRQPKEALESRCGGAMESDWRTAAARSCVSAGDEARACHPRPLQWGGGQVHQSPFPHLRVQAHGILNIPFFVRLVRTPSHIDDESKTFFLLKQCRIRRIAVTA